MSKIQFLITWKTINQLLLCKIPSKTVSRSWNCSFCEGIFLHLTERLNNPPNLSDISRFGPQSFQASLAVILKP